jgi:hypothetical protein
MNPYARRLAIALATISACGGGEKPPDTVEGTIRSLPGAAALDTCIHAPADPALQPYDQAVERVDCRYVVPIEDPCPDPALALPWPSGAPYAGCAALGRTVCVTGAGGRVESPMETGWLPDTATREERTDIAVCRYGCVVVTDGSVCGRPLRGPDGAACVAPTTARAGWSDETVPMFAGLPDDVRYALAARWLADAAMEHASIASFARLALDLLAHGAPADLVGRVVQAQQDEVAHARAAYSIASALLGEPVGPGPLALPVGPTPSLATLAADSVRDGCCNEAMAAAEAAARLAWTTHPALRAALARVVEDEARHAALAADVVAWAIEVGGPEVQAAVDAAWVDARRAPLACAEELVAPEVGLCGVASLAAAHAVVREVVFPA